MGFGKNENNPPASGRTKLDGERRSGRTARRTKRYGVFNGAPFGFPNPLPDRGRGRRKLNNGYGKTNGEMTGVADGAAMVIGAAMFVGRGYGLQADEAGQHERHQKRTSQPSPAEYTRHAPIGRLRYVIGCKTEGKK